MNKSGSCKRVLLMSLLSLVMCCAMLVGSTFAWFTDSVTSGSNKIVAGNLDVELEYAPASAAEGGTIAPEAWQKVESTTNLFDEHALWEPGHTEYVYLRVRNAGSLALKYEIEVNVFADAEGHPEKTYTSVATDEYGAPKTFKLSDYLVFRSVPDTEKVETRDSLWITDPAEERAAMGKLNTLYDTQTLEAGATNAFTLAVYMPTSVGNDANWDSATGEEKPQIFLGITVTAGQASQESDSFDNTYDGTAFATRCVKFGHDYGAEGLTCIYCGEANPFVRHHDEADSHYKINGVDDPSITELDIPGSIKGLPVEIEDNAFSGNTTLESVVLREGVEKIGNSAFNCCSAEITLPESIKEVGNQTFWKCHFEGEVNLPNIEKIGSYGFTNSNITSISIGDSLTSLGEYAFNGCTELETVEFGAGTTITSIPYSAFNGCASLKSIELPESVTTIGGYAFYSCSNLETIVCKSVTRIEERAFYECGLIYADFPKVTFIGKEAFRSEYTGYFGDHPKPRLTHLTFGSEETPLPTISIKESAFYGNVELTSIAFYSNTLSMEKWCFNDCTSLSSVTFSGDITAWSAAHAGLASWHNAAPEDAVITCNNGKCSWDGTPIS